VRGATQHASRARAVPGTRYPIPDFEIDDVLDSSLFGIYRFGLFDADDPRVESTMRAIEEQLWVKTQVGGVARYENDNYHRVSSDTQAVPGNPWFICTLWLADYFVTRARTSAELKKALPIFEWTASHALESGVLAEQVNPYTNEPISVSPLTWSHATVVSTVTKYLEKLEELQLCQLCNQPLFRLRRRSPRELNGQALDHLEAAFGLEVGRENLSPVGRFVRHDEEGRGLFKATVAVDIRDCIGCEICVAHCQQNVLKMADGKALVDNRNLAQCDLKGECVEVCPTNVVSITVQPATPPASPT
jgi:glucoamylase